MCDHRRYIRDVFVGFPGSVHDSRVFRASPLLDTLPEKCGEGFILADSGYPCLRHVLTPFRDRGQLTRQQRNYNITLSRNRYIIEHTFGLLKQKFRQLYHLKMRSIVNMVHLFRACCVLHNLGLDDDFPIENIEPYEDEIPLQPIVEDEIAIIENFPDELNGIQMRNRIMNNLQEH